jgi:riboflavin synthase
VFTGIITEIGIVVEAKPMAGGVELSIRAPQSVKEVAVNDSISVNGACQTVIGLSGEIFRVQAVEETLKKTTLGELARSSRVNLELSLRLGERLGGHLVLGHVDTVGVVQAVEHRGSSWLVEVSYPQEFGRYLILVGSVAVDGISLTVARLQERSFTVSIIPHTMEKTTLAGVRPGLRVNLEFDVLGKYVERLMKGEGGGEVSLEKLRSWGYS